MKTWPISAAGIITVVVFLAYASLLVASSWPIEDFTIRSAALFGDSFGVLNSFFTGGAFLLILWTIVLQGKDLEMQREELRLQRKEMSRVVASHQRELHMDLLNYAFNDEDLAKVWGEDSESPLEMRQTMYITLIFAQWYMNYREDFYDRATIEKSLNKNMKKSKYFRQYWEEAKENEAEIVITDNKHKEFYEMCEAAYQTAIASFADKETIGDEND